MSLRCSLSQRHPCNPVEKSTVASNEFSTTAKLDRGTLFYFHSGVSPHPTLFHTLLALSFLICPVLMCLCDG
jgi:hypothetical protein